MLDLAGNSIRNVLNYLNALDAAVVYCSVIIIIIIIIIIIPRTIFMVQPSWHLSVIGDIGIYPPKKSAQVNF